MHILKNIQIGVLGLAILLAAHNTSAEVVVIVSAKNSITTLRVEQVAEIFLGQTSNFPGGAEAVPIDLTIDSPLREEFYTKVTGKSAPLMKAYWSKMLFTGRGQPPKEMANSAAVKKSIADNPNLIGYIDKSAVDANVKIVLIIPDHSYTKGKSYTEGK